MNNREIKEKCVSCLIEYPEELIAMDVCGICALKISNNTLGVNRKKFNGEIAEELRQEAIKYRKANNL